MSSETMQLAEAMEAEMQNEVAAELSNLNAHVDPSDCEGWLDLRLQFVAGAWSLKYGDSCYDVDRRGNWGAASIAVPMSPLDRVNAARELVEGLLEDIAMSEVSDE